MIQTDSQLIPLFPLKTVLFPKGALPLRVFEPRYLDMVSSCLKEDTGFGICTIREGSEVGKAASTYEIGTFGKIEYWHLRSDGLLGITVHGKNRFRINSEKTQSNQLKMASVSILPDEPSPEIPVKYTSLVNIVRKIMSQLGQPYVKLPKYYENASWVGARLTELLPIELNLKQAFLELNDPIERLDRISLLVKKM